MRVLAISFLLFSCVASAQTSTASLQGTVTDPSGSVVSGASVSIKHTGTGITNTVSSGNDGHYVVPFLLPGQYDVTVRAPGFSTATTPGVRLAVQQSQTVDVILSVDQVGSSVEVAGVPPPLSTSSATVATTIENKAVVDLPLNGRNVLSLAQLVPGVVDVRGLASVLALSGAEERAVPRGARESLPLYQTIPAASVTELTPTVPRQQSEPGTEWSRSHGGPANMRYSSLDQINRGNVTQLAVAWEYHSRDGAANIQANPVIANGVMYAPTAGDFIVAVNAATGKELWRFRPEGHPATRGLLYWQGGATNPARVYFLSSNFLYVVDAKTGLPVAGFGVGGRVAIDGKPLPGGIGVVAPVIYRGVLVVAYMNFVKGLQVTSGKTLWTFNMLPRPGDFGSETWSSIERGVHCWGGMALDGARGIAYVSTGSPHPNMVGMNHHGTNLFSNSVVALDASTGKRVWHFQEIRHDIWDLDIPAPPVLVSVDRDGKRVDAVAQVTKIGNTLLLDRLTGKPLFPFRLRRAPESKIAEEETWPYQPDVELPEPFARQEFKKSDVTDLSWLSRDAILTRLTRTNYGWFEPFELGKPTVYYGIHGGAEWTGASFDPTTGWLYVSANEIPWIITVNRSESAAASAGSASTGIRTYLARCAACHGQNNEGNGTVPPLIGLNKRFNDEELRHVIANGRNGMPAIKLKDTEVKPLLDYLFVREPLSSKPPVKDTAEAGTPTFRYGFAGFEKLLDQDGYPGTKPPWGTLNALNLNTGKIMWKVPLGEYEELSQRGVPPTGTENFGGATVTAGGLVFCAGTRDHMIRAFDKDTGRVLWKYKLPFGGYAPPAIYSVKGRQYVVIAATGGGKLGDRVGDAWVAFALPPEN